MTGEPLTLGWGIPLSGPNSIFGQVKFVLKKPNKEDPEKGCAGSVRGAFSSEIGAFDRIG